MIDKLKAHPVLAVVVALLVGVVIGRVVPLGAKQDVREKVTVAAEQHSTSLEDLREERGEVTITKYAPRASGQPATVYVTRANGVLPCEANAGDVIETIRIAPSVIEKKSAQTQDQVVKQTLDLKLSDASRYSLLVGSRVLPSAQLELGFALRVFGPVWVQAQVAPKLSDPLHSDVAVLARLDF